jgi:ABC-type multidrug transport system permease subunit
MRFVLVAAAKDLRRRLADRAALVIWVGIPLILAFLMNLVIGGDDGVTPRARVLVVDEDQTLLSGFLSGGGGRGGVGNLVDLETVTRDEGQRRIDAGDASALLIVPAGFQAAVLDQGNAQLALLTNPSERILPGIVEEALEIVVEGVFYGQRLFGPVLRRVAAGNPAGPPSDADVASVSVEINQQLARLQGVLLPPVITVDVGIEQPASGQTLGFGQIFLPGLLFMSFLFIASGISSDVWEEKASGTMRRALTTPQSPLALLAGKVLAGVVLIAAIGLVALLLSVGLFGVAWARVPLALVWCAFAGGALIPLLMLLQVAASSRRGAELLGNVVTFPLIMLGGSFFPFDAMPAWMRAIGRWTPNGLGVTRLEDLLFGEVALLPLVVAGVAIAVPALVAFAATARRLGGRFAVS